MQVGRRIEEEEYEQMNWHVSKPHTHTQPIQPIPVPFHKVGANPA